MTSTGYHCEFIDQVSSDLYCKKCSLAARRITMTICCGETFCQDCIAGTLDMCPACGQKGYNTFPNKKFQKKLNTLRVYCTMKERGCDWTGTLEQLDTHLDPEQDNCQYMDIKCPLNCQQHIPRNKMEQHTKEECVKRQYTCKHCNYKDTYEEVVDKHLTQCKYVPLECPNRCGVACERDLMKDHMQICRLQKVECEFKGVGCDKKFRREDQEEHTRLNSLQHIALTAVMTLHTREQLQQNVLQQNEDIQKLKQKIRDLEKELENKERKLKEQDAVFKEECLRLCQMSTEKVQTLQQQKMNDQDKNHKEEQKKMQQKILELERKLQMQDQKHRDEEKKQNLMLLEQKQIIAKCHLDLSSLTNLALNRHFVMKNFSAEKAKDKYGDWVSPPMYTHVCGYKFCIGLAANGSPDGNRRGHGNAVDVTVSVMPGEYDALLKWPAKAKITIKLLHVRGGQSASGTCTPIAWTQPLKITRIRRIFGEMCTTYGFIDHSKLGDFLVNDTLHFHVSDVEILS